MVAIGPTGGSNYYGQTVVSSWQLGPMTPPAHAYSVTLQPSQILLEFASVTDEGLSSATAAVGSPAPAGLRILTGACWDVSSTAAFTGNVGVTVPYNDADLQGADEADIELYQYVSPGGWQRITGSVDPTNNTVTGTATSLTTFAVMAPIVTAPIVSTPASSGWSLGMLCIAGLGLVVVSRRRLQRAQG